MPAISVLMKPSSSMCNMSCDYCFYCDEAQKRNQKSYGFMSEYTLKNIIRKTMLRAEGMISYAYQGGEPTLRGLEFFEKAVAYQKQYNRNQIQVTNALQTNGYSITEDWCSFFKENNFLMNIASDKRWRNFDDMGNEIRYSPEVLAEFNKNATMWNPTSIGRPICMSYAVEDGSFLRLNSATLGYTLPSVWTKKVGLSKVRFYVSGNNLFTLTGYSGYDPEVNIATGLTPNIDYNRYPRSRTYTFGAQLTF